MLGTFLVFPSIFNRTNRPSRAESRLKFVKFFLEYITITSFISRLIFGVNIATKVEIDCLLSSDGCDFGAQLLLLLMDYMLRTLTGGDIQIESHDLIPKRFAVCAAIK